MMPTLLQRVWLYFWRRRLGPWDQGLLRLCVGVGVVNRPPVPEVSLTDQSALVVGAYVAKAHMIPACVSERVPPVRAVGYGWPEVLGQSGVLLIGSICQLTGLSGVFRPI